MIDYNITPEPELDVGISTNEITFGIAPAGATGLSAYEIWLKHGNQGTEHATAASRGDIKRKKKNKYGILF